MLEKNVGKRIIVSDPYSIRYNEDGVITEFKKDVNSYYVTMEDKKETLEAFGVGQVRVLN